MSSGADLDVTIAVEEARLADLDRLRDAARERISELHAARERRASGDAEAGHARHAVRAWSAERKVALFQVVDGESVLAALP
jgi:hypothetical protein